MTGRAQTQAARVVAWMAVLIGTAIGALADASFPFFDLVYSVPADPPIVVPVTIYPLSPIKFVVGLLFGPLAGLVTGAATQLASLALAGMDVSQTWNWVVADAIGGFLAGWLPRRLPASWRRSGVRRFAGAAVVGVVATAVGYLPILLDPFTRPDVRPLFALGEYLTTAVPIAGLTALTLPLALAVGLRLHVESPIRPTEPPPRARPSWRPFALALSLAIAVPLVPLYFPSSVRLVGPAVGGSGPAAAPEPESVGGPRREAQVALGDPLVTDPSCSSEGQARSPYAWATVDFELYNHTGKSVGLTWLDYDGHRQGNVPISTSPLSGQMGLGHVFMLVGADGGCLMIFKVVGTTPISIHLRS
jgi:hypothetical protein